MQSKVNGFMTSLSHGKDQNAQFLTKGQSFTSFKDPMPKLTYFFCMRMDTDAMEQIGITSPHT